MCALMLQVSRTWKGVQGWNYLLIKKANELPWKHANNSTDGLTVQTSLHSAPPSSSSATGHHHIPQQFSKTLLKQIYISSNLADTLYIYCYEITLSLHPQTTDSWERNFKVQVPMCDDPFSSQKWELWPSLLRKWRKGR